MSDIVALAAREARVATRKGVRNFIVAGKAGTL